MKTGISLNTIFGVPEQMIHLYAETRPEFREISNAIKAQMPLEKQRRIVRQAQLDSAMNGLKQTNKGK